MKTVKTSLLISLCLHLIFAIIMAILLYQRIMPYSDESDIIATELVKLPKPRSVAILDSRSKIPEVSIRQSKDKKSAPIFISEINLVGVTNDAVLPYGEELLRSADSIPKVSSLSSAVYELRKPTRFEPKASISDVAKSRVVRDPVPVKVNQNSLQFSVGLKFEDPTATGLEIPMASDIEGIGLPKWINKVKPEYPEAARRAGIEGLVTLEVEVKADGSLGEVKVVESLGYGCDEAAKAALQASKIVSAKQNGIPITMKIQIPYKFQLEEMD